ncbi:MAG: hypothetical protein U0441_28165 [Polyangiaceae bacterium]
MTPTSRIAALFTVTCALAAACGGTTTSSSHGGTTATGGAGGTTTTGGAGTTTTTAGSAGATSTGPIDYCTGCMLGGACSTFVGASMTELSGIVPSLTHDGVYYVHNDSGDSSRFFATNCAGDDLGTFEVKDASNVDWEDVERGPCGAKNCLFFADTGDNLVARTDYAVYRTEEPAEIGLGTYKVQGVAFPFVYPDGPHDAETLLIHPLTGEMIVVTKVAQGLSGLYKFPMPLIANQQVTLEKVGDITPPSGSVRITSGDVHPEAKGILLRTYTSLFFYAMTPDQTLEAALSAKPCEMPVLLELQGESVAFTANGRGYVTVSEMSGQSLHFATCQ